MRIRWTTLAESDLEQIEKYIASDNPISAIDTVLLIINKIEEILPQHPSAGRPGRIPETRELIINETYIIMYRVIDDWVEILRVLHSSRQWPEDI